MGLREKARLYNLGLRDKAKILKKELLNHSLKDAFDNQLYSGFEEQYKLEKNERQENYKYDTTKVNYKLLNEVIKVLTDNYSIPKLYSELSKLFLRSLSVNSEMLFLDTITGFENIYSEGVNDEIKAFFNNEKLKDIVNKYPDTFSIDDWKDIKRNNTFKEIYTIGAKHGFNCLILSSIQYQGEILGYILIFSIKEIEKIHIPSLERLLQTVSLILGLNIKIQNLIIKS